jgi:hypothetical protein
MNAANDEGDGKMMTRLFATAAAAAAMTMMLVTTAMAADIGIATAAAKAPGITVVDRGGSSTVKDVVLEAGTDPSVLELRFAHAQQVTFEGVGTLRIVDGDGHVWRYKPSVYQMLDGKRKDKVVGFHFIGKDRVSLKVDKLDPSAPLVVGPFGPQDSNL